MKRIIVTFLEILGSAMWRLFKRALCLLVRWCQRHPSQAVVAAIVSVIHLGIIITAANHSPPPTVIKPISRVVVTTVNLRKPKAQMAKAPSVPTPQRPSTPKKASPSKPKAKQDNDKLAEQQRLLQQALAHLDDINAPKKHRNDLTNIEAPPTLTGLQTETLARSIHDGVNPEDLGYCEELVRRLKLMLRLPEYGEVRVKLIISRQGSVTGLEVLSAQSQLNKNYIEKTLPALTFPPFGKNFQREKNHTFILAFSNDV